MHLRLLSSSVKPEAVVFFLLACLLSPLIGAGELTVTDSPIPVAEPTREEVIQQAALLEIPDVDVLAISDELKALLDKHVRPVRDRSRRAEKLHEFLFTQVGLDIKYDSDYTYSAQETFERRAGNCVSHAALYVASARYLGMKARFQAVEVPRTWELADDFYIVPGHVNAVINLPFGKRAVAEFVTTYYYNFDKKDYKEEIISDNRLLAEYYNNLGMEAMRDRNFAKAIAYLNKSIGLVAKNAPVWSNLGVVYKFIGYPSLAEQSYRKALDIEKRNISAIKNLYILYYQNGRLDEARQFARQVEKDNRKNPHFLARMATTDLELGNLDGAVSNITRAIKIDPTEETFYVTLAKIHVAGGNIDDSIEAMKKAAEHSKNLVNDYPKKLEMLQALR